MSTGKHLQPDRHPQMDFFIADILDAAPKDDMGSMEHPLFALRAGDKRIRRYEHRGTVVEVIPSVKGLATIHDKDILIYICSQVIEAMNRGHEVHRTVRLTAYDLLVTTNRRTDGDAYQRLQDALTRLRGTTVTTNIKTDDRRDREGWGLIERYHIVEFDGQERMSALEVTLSPWLWRALMAKEVLTLSREYFRLRKPIDRRVYEICRKHCGSQRRWKVGMEVLWKKSGSSGSLPEFRRAIKSLAESNQLPDYRIRYDVEKDTLTAYSRDEKGGMAQVMDTLKAGGQTLDDTFIAPRRTKSGTRRKRATQANIDASSTQDRTSPSAPDAAEHAPLQAPVPPDHGSPSEHRPQLEALWTALGRKRR